MTDPLTPVTVATVADTGTAHWNAAYAGGDHSTGWFEAEARTSLELLDALGVPPDASVVDVGGGASRFVDALIARGHRDLAVLDLSAVALGIARGRVGDRAEDVDWIAGDVQTWRPGRVYDVWHDRALLHFLVEPAAQAAYAATLRTVLAPDGKVILGTFASDGPDRCSGLPVARRDSDDLLAFLGDGFEAVTMRRQAHTTPGGKEQRFAWLAAARSPDTGLDEA